METIIATIATTLVNLLIVYTNNKYKQKQKTKLMEKLRYAKSITDSLRESLKRQSILVNIPKVPSLDCDQNEPYLFETIQKSTPTSSNNEEIIKMQESIENIKKYINKKKKNNSEKELILFIEKQIEEAEQLSKCLNQTN